MEKKIEKKNPRKILDSLVAEITDGKATKYMREKLLVFTDKDKIPCHQWSQLNCMITFLSGTSDARGIKQWNSVGRKIKKGAEAFYIFVPMIKKVKDDNGEEAIAKLCGYRLSPVFRIEDTEGEELEYQKRMKTLDLKSLPLIEVAEKLGIKVRKGIMKDAAGCFTPYTKTITLNSSTPQVFLHELSHAIDHELPNHSNDYAFNEVIAELSSAFLGSIYGVPVDLQNTKAYIESWAGKGHVAFQVAKALDRVENIYKFIKDYEPELAKSQSLIPTKKIKNRSQIFNSKIQKWVKRDVKSGLFTGVKKDGKPWTRIPFENLPPAA